MQVVDDFRIFSRLAEETSLKETGLNLAVPDLCKLVSQRVRRLQTGHRRHHVDDRFCAEPGHSRAPIVLKVVRYPAKNRPQQIALPGETLRPGWVRPHNGNMAKRPPRLLSIVHS